jgi:Rps23 Pro-64 3,4-dihydroxylase Tpa1-like proline 4-hydroxylase
MGTSVTQAHRAQFSDLGMAIIEDALPAETAEAVRAQFVAAKYELIDQVRDKHYEHVFRTESPYLPKPGEPYLARFRRARPLEESDFLKTFFAGRIRPILEDLAGGGSTKVDLRAYCMIEGDHQRVHIDEYAGKVGFIYYMSKGWKWDWGGLLMTATDDDEMHAAIPKFNQLIVLNHGKRRPPHWVTPVAPFAREPRYMLVGFMG